MTRLANTPANRRGNPESGEDLQQRGQQFQAPAGGFAQEVGYGFRGWNVSGQGHGRLHLPMRQAARSEQAAEGAMLGAPGAGSAGGEWGYRHGD